MRMPPHRGQAVHQFAREPLDKGGGNVALLLVDWMEAPATGAEPFGWGAPLDEAPYRGVVRDEAQCAVVPARKELCDDGGKHRLAPRPGTVFQGKELVQI